MQRYFRTGQCLNCRTILLGQGLIHLNKLVRSVGLCLNLNDPAKMSASLEIQRNPDKVAPQPGSGIQISCAEGQKTSPSTSFLLGELGGILSSPPTPTLAPWYYTPYFLPSPFPYLVVRRHVPRRHAPRHYAPS